MSSLGMFAGIPQRQRYTFGNVSQPTALNKLMFGTPMPSQQASISAYKPSLGEILQSALSGGLQKAGVGQHHASDLADKATNFLNDLTPVGSVLQGFNAGQQFGKGNYLGGIGGTALAALGAVPETNYLEDLGRYAPKLFRETSLDQAPYFIPKSNSVTDLRHELYFADNPDLALGQGSNRGVMMEFDSPGIKGKVNTSKPGWQAHWENGNAEYVGKLNSQPTYQNNLSALTIRPDAISSAPIHVRERVGRTLKSLEQSGWEKSVNADNSITWTRP